MDWPDKPPHPTDFSGNPRRDEFKICPYCLSLRGAGVKEHRPCPNKENKTKFTFQNNWFGIVVPEESNTIWSNKCGGFACRYVNIQGTLYPIGEIYSSPFDAVNTELKNELEGKFESFENPEEAKSTYIKGIIESEEFPDIGRGPNLGEKLREARLHKVYNAEPSDENLVNEREKRVRDVWGEIDSCLNFEYERVSAPIGFPKTQEGLRWIDVKGHKMPEHVETKLERARYKQNWIVRLAELDQPVALFYPNCD